MAGSPAACTDTAQSEPSAVTPASNARLFNRESIHVSGFKGLKLRASMLKSGRPNYHPHRQSTGKMVYSRLFVRPFARFLLYTTFMGLSCQPCTSAFTRCLET